ncbi:MAG TPA: heme ABC exporter ATP-binding protein CcmA [Gemmatimonadales bacterium]|nr:heme ABC exporter ATP-binding protein CcmA [Gemmatimonadales bacterium]
MRPSEGPLLVAAGLSRAFGPLQALRGIDLALGAGETLVVFGPNGAGKSTLLRLLAGIMRPTSGEIRVGGRPVRPGDAASRRGIGLVSHQSFLYDDLSLLDNLVFAARLHGVEHPHDVARAALADAGLGARMHESPRALSRGLQQRVSIARALLHEPVLLLLDEPFTGLDSASAARLRSALARRASEGRAAVLVTHQLAEAWELATRVAVLSAGRRVLEERRTGDYAAFAARAEALVDA